MPPNRRNIIEQQWDSWMDLLDSNGNKFSDWCVKGKNDFTVCCVFCKATLCVTSGKHQLMQHSRTLRHRTADETKKDFILNQPDNIPGGNVYVNDKPSSSSGTEPNTLTNEVKPMNEYEKLVDEKGTENAELFKSVGIDEAKNDCKEVIYDIKERKPRKFKERPTLEVQRTSKRLKEHVDYAQELPRSAESMRLYFHPTEQIFKKALKSEAHYGNFVDDFKEILETKDTTRPNPVLYDREALRQLSQKATTLSIPNISAMSWYPSTDSLVIAVGDWYGNLNLSNIEASDFDFHTFPVHSKRISNLQMNPSNPFHLISSSIDGKVLCCDIQAQIFSEVLSISERGCTYFDFISPSSYIVSLTNGQVVVLDTRTRNEDSAYRQKHHTCHSYSINTVNMHPVNQNYFVTTASKDYKILIWDLRKMIAPVILNKYHMQSVISASFSPISGKYLLSKSPDELCIFNCANMTKGGMEVYNTIKYTDIKLQDSTKPVWLPNSDDTFACSFKNSPILYVFDKDLNIFETVSKGAHGFKRLVTFHPFRKALACAMKTNRLNVCT